MEKVSPCQVYRPQRNRWSFFAGTQAVFFFFKKPTQLEKTKHEQKEQRLFNHKNQFVSFLNKYVFCSSKALKKTFLGGQLPSVLMLLVLPQISKNTSSIDSPPQKPSPKYYRTYLSIRKSADQRHQTSCCTEVVIPKEHKDLSWRHLAG